MGLFSRLFGKKSTVAAASTEAADRGEPLGDPIKVVDSYGRELAITRHEWLNNVLIGNLEKAREDPDQLYNLLLGAINDGFEKHVVKYAERLHEIDPQPARCATLLGIIYMKCNRLNDAERILQEFLSNHGEDGVVLVNLAKVYSDRGKPDMADATLWRALQVDPNQQNGLLWFHAIAKERGGETAGLDASRSVAELPKSWLARMWLARFALESKENGRALSLYKEAISLAPRPLPAELLMQLTGDLGNHGLLVEALRLAMPHFDPQVHGIMVGNNLIKANVDLGRPDHARAIVDQLYGLKRPDFQPTLAFWDNEIAKACTAANADMLPDRPQVSMMTIEGPIWLRKSSPAHELLSSKSDNAVVLCLMSGSADTGEQGEPRLQMSNEAGRLARSLPMFLSEQFQLRTDGIGIAMQPMIIGGPGGFLLAGTIWPDEDCADYARQCTPVSDYVVITHIDAKQTPFEVTVRLVRTIDRSLLASKTSTLDPIQPGPGFLGFAEWLEKATVKHAHCLVGDPIAAYQLPSGNSLNRYLFRLEQALAVAAADSNASPEFLSGEREIISGQLQLCLEEPANVTTRLLVASTLHDLKKVRPNIVDEFCERVELLQKQYPLREPFHRIVEQCFAELYLK